MIKLNLRFTKQTAIFTFLLVATQLISVFNSNANAQTIESIQPPMEETVTSAFKTLDDDAANYAVIPSKPIETSSQELERDYVLNFKKMNKSVLCMAQNAYFEAGGESFKSKVAVTQVVKTRSMMDGYPSTECGVVRDTSITRANKRTCQFSWWCAGRREIPLYDRDGQVKPKVYQVWYDCVRAALLVYNDKAGEVVAGATHFYAHRIVKPVWASKMKVVAVIGNHTFVGPRN